MPSSHQEKPLRLFLRPNAATSGTTESQLLSFDRPVARLSTSIESTTFEADAMLVASSASVPPVAACPLTPVLLLPSACTLH